MAAPTSGSPNGFVRIARKLRNAVGFTTNHNFVLWCIFFGALMGFSLSRTPYLNFYGVFCAKNSTSSGHAAPGECWYYLRGNHETVGIIMHLGSIIPGAFLAGIQFIPKVRHSFILFHRINGYVVITLALVATVGAFMILRHAFGGGLDIQMVMGLTGIMFIGSLAMAYVNIKRLQIGEHRAWMLRAWFYAGSIITLRIIMGISAAIISDQGGYFTTRPCGQIDDALNGNRTTVLKAYPDCAAYYSSEVPDRQVIVQADLSGNRAETAAALGLNFGAAGWLALALHAIGIEIYLALTPAEHERLRNVSYLRQVEAGMKARRGTSLTADRSGDATEGASAGP